MRKLGDRKDGRLLRNIDSMHFICPILYPNRCDNEAFISETLDLTKTLEYLNKKNKNCSDNQYKLFQIIVAAICKTICLREKMNRFIVNSNTYQRNDITASFVVKKQFNDKGEEALAVIKAEKNDTMDSIHEKITNIIKVNRSDKKDSSTDSMDLFNKLPRFIAKTGVKFVMFLDKHGWVPNSLIETDPYYTSVVLTNLGSIKLHAGYHHLTNWGTASIFVIIGEQKKRPFYDDDGNATMKDSIDIGLTIDERIADGYYYSKTVALFKKLIENPELLDEEFSKEVNIDK